MPDGDPATDGEPRRRTAWKRSHIRGEPDAPAAAGGSAGSAGGANVRGDEGRDAPAPRAEAGADVGRGSRAGGQDPATQQRVWREAEAESEK